MLVFPLALPPAIPTKKGCNYFYLIYFEFIAKFEKLLIFFYFNIFDKILPELNENYFILFIF